MNALSFLSIPKTDSAQTHWPRFGWGLFLSLFLFVLAMVLGIPLGYISGLALGVGVLFAWRCPQIAFYVVLATAPMIEWFVSIPVWRDPFNARLFDGWFAIHPNELVALVFLAGWALRLLIGTVDSSRDERPWLPFAGAFSLLVFAHIVSGFSAAEPGWPQVILFALHPVLWVYLVSVVVPVNTIRRERTLMISLAVLTALGTFFALDSLRSVYSVYTGWSRLHPMPFFGVYPLGDNHNVLAELLLFTAPVALALSTLLRETRLRLAVWIAAGFMTLVALLTFARTAWITLFVECAFLAVMLWRPLLHKYARTFLMVGLALTPLVLGMAVYSLRSDVQSSTDARAMLTGISWSLFLGSPWIGVGAGTFVDRVGLSQAYHLDFGGPMDAHGVLQKLAAETGFLGLTAFVFVMISIAILGQQAWKTVKKQSLSTRLCFLLLASSVMGAFTYQLFNTTYWSPKLWLPVGIFLAAARLFSRGSSRAPSFFSWNE